MVKILRNILFLGIAASVLASCAADPVVKTNAGNKRYFDAWIHIQKEVEANYPSAYETGNGIWVLEETIVPGALAWNGDVHQYAILEYTVTDLDNVVQTTTSRDIAFKVGLDTTAYFGPRIQGIGESMCNVGLEDALQGMTVGSVRKVAIPSWLQTSSRYKTADEYLDYSVSASDAIYTIKLVDALEDVYEWEKAQLKKYSEDNLGDTPATWPTPDDEENEAFKDGFYFLCTGGPAEPRDIPADTTVYINYTGRILTTGKVFDTTVARTAKDWGIYNPSRDYSPVQINWSESYSDITMGESETSVVTGFKAGLSLMKDRQSAIVAFWSPLGYGYSGSGTTIPGYMPLIFELEIVENK